MRIFHSRPTLICSEAWYSVTPEPVARHIAQRIYSKLGPNALLLDALCGVGGNTIQFALIAPLVFAIDIDPLKVGHKILM